MLYMTVCLLIAASLQDLLQLYVLHTITRAAVLNDDNSQVIVYLRHKVAGWHYLIVNL